MSNQGRGGFGGGGSPLDFVVKGVAAGIGLASESIQHHKEKKAALQKAKSAESQHSDSASPPAHEDGKYADIGHEKDANHPGGMALEGGDEEQWDLDDAQDNLITEPPTSKKRPFEQNPTKIIKQFTDNYPLPEGFELKKLALPVVLPQRRPKTRARGFIRAYAPDLKECGIDEPMFLDFLETFNMATQASPWLNAINLAGLAFIPLPFGVNQAATLALAMAVQVAKKMQSRHRYNSCLDQLNDNFYRPRGLYCLMLTWEPESDQLEVGVNVNAMINDNTAPPEGIVAKIKHSQRPSMGKSNGVPFVETAPLVFPALDALAVNSTQEDRTNLEKIKSAKSFASDYLDRRAQADYNAKHSDSQLIVGPKPSFTSRYSDPTNPSNSGDMLALLTGGKLSMPQRGGGFTGRGGGGGGGFGGGGGGFGRGLGGFGGGRGFGGRGTSGMNRLDYADQQRYGEQQQYPDQQQQQQMATGPNPMQSRQNIGFGGTMLLADGVKRILKRNVLYLLIVNMPTDEEMRQATLIVEEHEHEREVRVKQ